MWCFGSCKWLVVVYRYIEREGRVLWLVCKGFGCFILVRLSEGGKKKDEKKRRDFL